MHQITVNEAEADIKSILRNLVSGEEIIITDHDEPYAKLIRIAKPKDAKGRVGFAKGYISWIADDFDATPAEFKEYM